MKTLKNIVRDWNENWFVLISGGLINIPVGITLTFNEFEFETVLGYFKFFLPIVALIVSVLMVGVAFKFTVEVIKIKNKHQGLRGVLEHLVALNKQADYNNILFNSTPNAKIGDLVSLLSKIDKDIDTAINQEIFEVAFESIYDGETDKKLKKLKNWFFIFAVALFALIVALWVINGIPCEKLCKCQ